MTQIDSPACTAFEGLLSSAHVEIALRLRHSCGTDRQTLPAAIEDATDAAALLTAIRPIDQPIDHPPEALVNAYRQLVEYAGANGGGLPRWETAAFWWLAAAVVSRVSPEQLAVLVDAWRKQEAGAGGGGDVWRQLSRGQPRKVLPEPSPACGGSASELPQNFVTTNPYYYKTFECLQ